MQELNENEKKMIEEGGLAGAWAVATIQAAREQSQKELAQKALGHKHNNVLAEYVKRDVYSFGLKTGRLAKCECGCTLVLKPRWANGEVIKVKSNSDE